MNCKKCGSQLDANDQFCKNCGEPVIKEGMGQTSQTVETLNAGQPALNNMPYQAPQNNMGNSFSGQSAGGSKNNNIKYILIGFLIAAVIAGIAIALILMNTKQNNSGTTNDNGGSSQPVANNPNPNTYKVSFQGFTFAVPDELEYEIDDTELYLYDSSEMWVAVLSVGEKSFDYIKRNKNRLIANFESNGFSASNVQEKTVGGETFVTVELEESFIVAYAKLDATHSVAIALRDLNEDLNYDLLEKMAPIVSSAKAKSGASNKMSIDTKIDHNAILNFPEE